MTGSGIISALHGAAAFSHVTNPNGGKTMLDKNIPGKGCNEMCCIDVNKIFDSARDKDCLENLRVFLSADAQEALDRASSIRCRNVDIVSTSISLETVPFNKGYYQVNVRFYFCCTFDVCIYNGTVQEIRGVAACDKRILLFGGEKNISIFTSDPNNNSFCPQAPTDCEAQSTLPTAVVEVAAPICLDTRVVDCNRPFGSCCCGVDALPDSIRCCNGTPVADGFGTNRLFVTIGIFTVIRLVRPVQIMLPSCNYCLPDKDSTPAGCANDPCSVFASLGFPTGEFIPSTEPQEQENPPHQHGCGGR